MVPVNPSHLFDLIVLGALEVPGVQTLVDLVPPSVLLAQECHLVRVAPFRLGGLGGRDAHSPLKVQVVLEHLDSPGVRRHLLVLEYLVFLEIPGGQIPLWPRGYRANQAALHCQGNL